MLKTTKYTAFREEKKPVLTNILYKKALKWDGCCVSGPLGCSCISHSLYFHFSRSPIKIQMLYCKITTIDVLILHFMTLAKPLDVTEHQFFHG